MSLWVSCARVTTLVGIVAACGPEPVGSTESGTSDEGSSEATTAGTSSVDLRPECVCQGAGCGVTVCPKVTREVCNSSEKVSELAASACVLTALRDRKPGQIAWEERIDCGYSSESVTLTISEDGTALVDRSGWEDSSSHTGPRTYSKLRSPDYFDACLMTTDAAEAFACVSDAIFSNFFECVPRESLPTRW